MEIIISQTQHSRLIKKLKEEKDSSAKFIKCRNCNKKYTQTIHKGKKSKPICPHCGTHEDLKEYFDPIYYIKKKTEGEPKYVKDPMWEPYEEEFQKLVDFVFKKTKKMNDFERLKGLKVDKVTPQSDKWIVVLTPVADDWFNWAKNKKFHEDLEAFRSDFKEFVRMGGIDSPHQMGKFPRDIEFIFSRA